MKEKQNTGRWSKEEDKMLIEYVRRNGPRNWKDASDYVKNRNPKQLNKKPFNRKEELEIIRLREREHSRWRDIAKKIGNGRTPNAIKNIYTQQLSKRVRRPLRIEEQMNVTLEETPHSIRNSVILQNESDLTYDILLGLVIKG
ncbi:20062_t:CDS:2 [Entrophospora sp. SA101]|nr:20062_t:CDS:2 [Entrophospora sp. SA101]CAJ0833990.1 7482_t:CDS:2 [Entrophospora sp. SA101]